MSATPADLEKAAAASAAAAVAAPTWPFDSNKVAAPSTDEGRPPSPSIPSNEHVTWLPEMVLTMESDQGREQIGGSMTGAVVGPPAAQQAYEQDMVGGPPVPRSRL